MQTFDVIVGMDVGKSFHWLHAITNTGDVIASHKIDQDEHQLEAAFTALRAGGKQVLGVVDQPKNIGALTLDCATRAGCEVSYLPGLAMRRAAGILPGDAKTDQRDAQVIAYTARVMPESLRAVGASHDRAQMEALVAYDHDCMVDKVRELNRLHALLAEVNPRFEKAIYDNIGSVFILNLLQRFGGPWSLRAAGKAKVTRWAATQKRVPAGLLDTALQAAWSMDHKPAGADIHEQYAIPAAARRIAELAAARKANETRIDTMLAANPTYQALRTMPGVGHCTAAALVTIVDITRFPNHEKLASYAGIAARTQQSGTSIKGETASRSGNKTLKNALYMSAFASLQKDPIGRAFYDAKISAGKKHNTALIALARKRLKIMYAIMRDNTPYQT